MSPHFLGGIRSTCRWSKHEHDQDRWFKRPPKLKVRPTGRDDRGRVTISVMSNADLYSLRDSLSVGDPKTSADFAPCRRATSGQPLSVKLSSWRRLSFGIRFHFATGIRQITAVIVVFHRAGQLFRFDVECSECLWCNLAEAGFQSSCNGLTIKSNLCMTKTKSILCA